jgi:branched-chain amino acid transport system permease protein
MGESFLLNALIALAIGGLTSYPGAALGSLLVGLLQQFIIKYGQIGIAIPFTEIVFKPTPPIVPARPSCSWSSFCSSCPTACWGKRSSP